MGLMIKNLRVVPPGQKAFQLTIPLIEVSPGQISGVMGKSGSGKSTLLTALGGFLPYTTGQVRIEGEDRSAFPPEKRRLAYVFQKNTLFPHLSAERNISFPLEVAGKSAAVWRPEVKNWAERFGIAAIKDRRPHEISGGEAQRVALARALVSGFKVLLFDEPFSALDPRLRRDLRAEVAKVVNELKLSVLWVTHDLADLEIFSSVVVLENGNVSWQGAPSAMPQEKYF